MPAVTVPTVYLDMLRRAFDARLIIEVQAFGGIPWLPPEEVALRDAIARLLEAADQ